MAFRVLKTEEEITACAQSYRGIAVVRHTIQRVITLCTHHRHYYEGVALTQTQQERVWENMLAAETRSLYFGDLASRYSLQKQWITGVSFFLSSAAAATVVAKAPAVIPATTAMISALANAYSIAVGLDKRIQTMAKLHSSWNRIAAEYQNIWDHMDADDAEGRFLKVIDLEREPSEIATTSAPNDQKLLGKWQDVVLQLHHVA